MKKTFKWILGIVALFYIVGCAILYTQQESLLFLPDSLSTDHIYRKGVEHKIQVQDGIEISCYWLKTPNPKGVIIYMHGNKGNNRRCIRQSEMMEGLGYDIFMPDYRGFGKSEGVPISDDQFYEDAQQIYDLMIKEYGEENIVIVGYSMGSGPSTYLAGQNKPKELFLLSPFKSIVDMKDRYIPFVPDFLVKYQFPNWKYLEQTTCPINIFYSDVDQVVLPGSTLALVDYSNHEQLTLLENTSHRGMIFHGRWRQIFSERLRDN